MIASSLPLHRIFRRQRLSKGFPASLVFLLALAMAPVVFGQQKSPDSQKLASIHGTLKTKPLGGAAADASDGGLAGIAVKLTSQAPSGEPVSTETDEAGNYHFSALKAGSYTISVVQQGFKPISKAVTLIAGQDAIHDFLLELATVSEKIEVSEQAQTVANENVSAPASAVTERQLASIPTAQEKVREVLPVTPGVVRTQDGKLSFRGADENQSMFLVNSARTTDPVTGSFSINVPTDAVQSFAVYKTPYNASLGSFSGGLTTVDTKPPQDHWNYKVKNFIPSVLGKNNHMVGLAEATPGVDFGGPLLASKLFFSEVFQYDMKKRTVRGLAWPNDISKRQGFNSYTTLEAILSPKQILTFTVNAFPLRQQNIDINALEPPSASNDLDQSGVTVALSDRYQFDSGAILSGVMQYTRFDSNAHGQGPANMLITPEGWGGNFFNSWSRRGKEFQFLPAYQFAEKHWLGRHELHVGLDVSHRSYFGTSASHPVDLQREDGTLAEEITFQGAASQEASDTAVAEFFQDHWVLNPHWAVDAGARFSTENIGWSGTAAPRLGVAYSPGKDAKTVIRTGAGIFYNLVPLLAADFAENPARTVALFDATGQPLGVPVSYTNAYVGRGDPLSGTPLPAQPQTTPRNFTWSTEVERELPRTVRLRVGYIDSHTTYLFTVQPFTAPPGAPSFLGLTNTGASHYREVETTVHFKVHEHNEVNASYIWSRTRGDLNDLSSILIPFAAPVIRPNVYGISQYDVPNRVVTWGIFALPWWQMTFSPIIDVHTGYPYSAVDELQNYVGTPNGQRFNPYFSADIKLYRTFRVPFLGSKDGKGHHVRLGAYSLNVTNHHNWHDVYNNVASPAFGQFAGFLDRREGAVIDFLD